MRKSNIRLAAERQVKERKIWLKKEPEEYQKESDIPPGTVRFKLVSPKEKPRKKH